MPGNASDTHAGFGDSAQGDRCGDLYERNPRRATDDRISELKESIHIDGIKQMVTVTRRPNVRDGQREFQCCDFLYLEGG
ncbi:hypothetical protein PPGU19_100190 (plasmid) [Paraburkholderia sp. PGU19]|nr:hypothetical protein PPGU19_100190 [Paraburkholderia sp. PGU19]